MTYAKKSRRALCTTDSNELWALPATISMSNTFRHGMKTTTAVRPIDTDQPVLVIAKRRRDVGLGLDYTVAIDKSP
jgi:hypothetical protein